AAAELHGERLVFQERGGRRHLVLERGGVDDRLERAPRLAERLADAIELALVVAPAADVREDRAALRLDRDERRLQPLLVPFLVGLLRRREAVFDRLLRRLLVAPGEGREQRVAAVRQVFHLEAALRLPLHGVGEVRRPP